MFGGTDFVCRYLKNFRVEQCPLFKEHQCPNHKPFTCFHWHFWNQRRRRPIRKRDGTFNYSPDVYCTKYDEASGICVDGDNCPYLHKTAGDTEKHYHLRHYKTCMCMYDTDAKGFCKKNGPHCAYAHGAQDLRAPVLDIREIQAQENQEEGSSSNGSTGPNNLDKERNLGEDPKWQDTNYVLANYKTEPCKKPPRLCRQGYTCPQYHNSRDRRRSPRKHKYRLTTPCPHVKHIDEWGEPGNCEHGDSCQYCHTRTEQQFHPEIYKSSKCNDMQQSGYCPRGVFCAFAHVDNEITTQREISIPSDGSTCLATFISSALPQSTTNDSGSSSQSNSRCSSTNGNSNNHNSSNSNGLLPPLSMSDLSSAFSNRSGAFLPNSIGKSLTQSSSPANCISMDSHPTYHKAPGSEREDKEATIRKQMLAIGNALDELSINTGPSKELENDGSHLNNSISVGLAESGLLGGSAPVTIPGSSLKESRNPLSNLTPPVSSPLSSTPPTFLQSHIGQPRPEHPMDQAMASAFLRQPNTITANKFSSFPAPGFYDFPTSTASSSSRPTPHSPIVSNSAGPANNNIASFQQLWDELQDIKGKFVFYKDRMEEEITKVNAMMKRIAEHITGSTYNSRSSSGFNADVDSLSFGDLSQLRQSMINESDAVDKQLMRHPTMKCMACNEKLAKTRMYPCAHMIVCSDCAPVVKTCHVCGQIVQLSNFQMSL